MYYYDDATGAYTYMILYIRTYDVYIATHKSNSNASEQASGSTDVRYRRYLRVQYSLARDILNIKNNNNIHPDGVSSIYLYLYVTILLSAKVVVWGLSK